MFKIRVKENEKALIYKDEKLEKILETGVHKLFHLFQNYKVERIQINREGIKNSVQTETLYKKYPKLVDKYFHVVKLEEHERAYVWVDGKFETLLECGDFRLYGKEYDIKIEKVDVKSNYKISEKDVLTLMQVANSFSQIKKVIITENQVGYLYVNHKFVDILDVGQHFYYTDFYDIEVKAIDTRIKELEITGQELLSSDKVTLRCNLTMHYKITNGREYIEAVNHSKEYLYKQLQFAIREHLGALTIDEILSKQHTLTDEILQKFYATCKKVGVEVDGVYIKDIILPGEMREIFNQVIEASKRAEANNIKRREETASTRSLLNTAKLMSDNPALARLKELEALEKITQTIGTLNVYGGLDGVMNGLVDLKGDVRV